MKQSTRIFYTDAQKALMWERWNKAGRCTRSLNCSIAPIPPFKASWSGLEALDRRDEPELQVR